jgi:hypothetical protein
MSGRISAIVIALNRDFPQSFQAVAGTCHCLFLQVPSSQNYAFLVTRLRSGKFFEDIYLKYGVFRVKKIYGQWRPIGL